jgi:heme exporter protein C
VLGLLSVLEIPLVHFSVELWRSLHQKATLANVNGEVKIDGLMLFSLFVGLIAFSLMYFWLVMHRQRVMYLEDRYDDADLDVALAERRAETAGAGGAAHG